MHIKPDTLAMTVMLAFMTALGPLATDLYLPSLPHIGAELGAAPAAVQLTLSAYLIGFSAGQIFYGPISDAVGRKPVLLAAFGIFLLATVACAAAVSIDMLIAARVAQAFGGAGPIILARTMVRDLYEGPRAGRELSMMGSIMGVTPVIAPIFGGFLQVAFGWRASFVAMALAALGLVVIAALLLPETIRSKQTGGLSPAAIWRSYAIVLRNPTYRVYVGLLALSYAGLFAFISASSFVMQGVYGLGEVAFGAAFAVCSASFVVGTLIGTRLVSRKGFDRTIAVGVLLLAVGGVGQFLGVILFPGVLAALIAPEMLFFAGIGLVLPQAMAGAMSPFPDRAGAASSLAGFVQMVFASISGAVIGLFVNGSAMPLVVASALAGLGALALFHIAKRLRRRAA
ncbi:MAG: multidrug effflux MFS transporter [Beijerinckiaceae bacterium]|jgi:MFS transporter, DHA1 family, multidrug resistance protein|nr:multidrug effflux MFS transporter [Beijerinckiaceae bacterium]MDO9439443.1 multidrug effflux MFS transporter [Beijerinckiaceae bacterium]